MISDSICTTRLQPEAATDEHFFDSWFDPIERAVRDRVRSFIEELIEDELAAVLARPRYGRRATDGDGIENAAGVAGHHRIQGCGARSSTLQKRAPLDIVMPTTASVPSCSEPSRYGLETLMLVALPE